MSGGVETSQPFTGTGSLSPQPAAVSDLRIEEEVARRRTFAIISHPDAGKTTLTEKFLLYAGAVDEAGSVRARHNVRRSTSDWMEMERQRGISITSTALQFDAFGCRFNLLDTPGHQDFSEDTYRTLLAVDSVVMVLDAANGIEPQTEKLFAVCRDRGLPIVTFLNKLDRPSRDPLELIDEIERVLGMSAHPMNWPIGDGPTFAGVFDFPNSTVLQFTRTEGGRFKAPVRVGTLEDSVLTALLGDRAHAELREQVALLSEVAPPFVKEEFLRGAATPVFFGSALNNFGVEPFLSALAELAPAPMPRSTSAGPLSPVNPEFSGFIFKIQANMDPLHRDRMAFLRVCSGRFERDMPVFHSRLGRMIRLSRPHRLFAGERSTIAEAFPGDVVGLINPGMFRIGDTVTLGSKFQFDAVPRFSPECFARLEGRTFAKTKQFDQGLKQLEEEGAVSVLREPGGGGAPILAAVGQLQFEVVVARLAAEYGVETSYTMLPHTLARRVASPPQNGPVRWPRSTIRLFALDGTAVALFLSGWEEDYCLREHPGLRLEALT